MSETLKIVDARVIQMEDLEETAEWCGGEIGMVYEGDNEGQHYIQLDDFHSGLVGSWICQIGDREFVILTDEDYKGTFHAASKNREKYAAVLKVVQAVVADSVSDLRRDGNNLNMIAEAAALRIMELTEK